MHGAAQPAFPLLAEPEAPFPGGAKLDAKSSRHSAAYLWEQFLALPDGQKALMRLKALMDPPANKSVFQDAVRRAELKPGGRPRNWATLNTELQSLLRTGLLTADLGCAGEILHAVAMDARACADAENLTSAAKAAMPKSNRDRTGQSTYYYYNPKPLPQDLDLFRHMRLAIYACDETEFMRLLELVEAEGASASNRAAFIRFLNGFPLSRDWFAQLPAVIRETFAGHAIRLFVEYGGEHAGEMGAIFQHYASAAPEKAGNALNKLLLRSDILSANFVRARQRIAALPEDEAHIGAAWEASIAFLTGDNDTALAGFRDALKRLRKAEGRRKVAFEAEAGLFHVLALLRAGDSALHAEIRGLIDAATQQETRFYLAYSAIGGLIDLAEGRHDKARQTVKRLLEQSPGAPAATAIVALAALYTDLEFAREFAKQNESEYNRFAQSMPVLARIYAEILGKTSRNSEIWRERAAARGGEGLIAFTEIIPFKQPWERAFDTLAAFLAPAEAKRPVEKAPGKGKRLAWLVDLTSGEVTVVEQSPKGAGWTGGRPIALKRLHQRDAKLDYLTEHDQRMCRCVRKEQGWYGDGNFYFDEYATLPALAGHPNVYNATKPCERVELITYPVELVAKETAKGYNFNLSHRASEPKVFLEAETPTRWRVVELSKKLLELQATLTEHGLTVPAKDARPRR